MTIILTTIKKKITRITEVNFHGGLTIDEIEVGDFF